MLYELHLTVQPDAPIDRWTQLCSDLGIKPLLIQLTKGTNPRQVMFAAVHEGDDDTADAWAERLERVVVNAGFNLIRRKLEVPLDKSAPYMTPVYHECHVKTLVPTEQASAVIAAAEAQGWAVSRNLLYAQHDGLEKWYLTQRDYNSLYLAAARKFADAFAALPRAGYHTVRMESETVVSDSNEWLDEGWAI
jgi:hypothetical protein